MKKRGGAELIAAILLIMIVIVVISIVIYFFLNYLEKKKDETDLLSEMGKENVGIDNVRFNADNKNFTMHLEKGPGSQRIKEIQVGAAASTQGIVLVSDVSGSMEWCTGESETLDKLILWNISTEDAFYCGKRRFNLTDCGDKKIDVLKEATGELANFIINNPAEYPNTKLGVVEYSSGNAVEKLETSDLSVALYVTANPGGCDEKDWMNKSFDDSTWSDYTATLSGSSCSRCKFYFRKHFTVTDLQKIESLTLSLAHKEGAVCYINGKEVFYVSGLRTASRFPWTSQVNVPIKVLEEGDNTFACAVMTHGGALGFDALLKAGNDILLNEQQSGWKYLRRTGCSPASSDYDPKNIRTANNTLTEINLLATIKNLGKPIEDSFEVAFYNGTSRLLDTVTVNGIKSRELKAVKINFTDIISTPMRRYIVEVDRGNIIPETTDANNNASRDVYTYPPGKDLTSDVYEVHQCYQWGPATYTDRRITIYNYGTENITEDFNVTLYDQNNNIIGVRRIKGGEINASPATNYKNVFITWTPNPPLTGPVNIHSFADSGFEVAELNENNNNDTETIDLRQIDMRVTDIGLVNPICSLVPNTATIRVYFRSYDCNSLNVSSVGANRIFGTWAGNVQAIPPLVPDTTFSRDFTVPLIIPILGVSFQVFAGVDTIENVSESPFPGAESNNNYTKTLNSGPNLQLTDFEVSPSIVESGKSTNFKITANFSNDQCGTGEFNVTVYKDTPLTGEVICRQSFSFAGAGVNSMVCYWTASLTVDPTRIYVVLDPENSVFEHSPGSTDNQGSAMITVQTGMSSLTPFSIIPLSFKLPNIFLSFKDMIIDDCDGNAVNLFNPEASLPRVQDLSDNAGVINQFAAESESWWDTCICCGIDKARNMLTATAPGGEPLYVNKAIILMSDGVPNIDCGGGDATADAIAAASTARGQGITVYAVGFGPDAAAPTLTTIAGDPSRYRSAANKEELLAAFKQFASAMKVTYEAVPLYNYVKITVYAKGTSYSTTRPYSDMPAPLEEGDIPIDIDVEGWPITNSDITKIELYAVAITEGGKEIISQAPIAVWERPSSY